MRHASPKFIVQAIVPAQAQRLTAVLAVETQRACAPGCQREQTADDRDVFHKHELLHHLLFGRQRPVIVEHHSRDERENGKRKRSPAGFEAKNERETTANLDDDGDGGGNLREWRAFGGDVANRACETGNFADSSG